MNWKKEYKECLLNNKYMLEKYIFKNKLWQIEEELLETVLKNNLTIVTKSRNVGFTSLVAGLSAREIALNSEKKVSILYLSQNGNMCSEFKNRLKSYLKNIPEYLFTGEEKYNIQTGLLDNYLNYVTYHFDICIIDEPVACNDNINVIKLVDFLKTISNKIIIGGTGNHNNETWFDFISRNKDNVPYIKMQWISNPNNKNKDFNFIKECYRNRIEDFEEEIECKVWKKIYL